MPSILAEDVDHLTLRRLQDWNDCSDNPSDVDVCIINMSDLTDQRHNRMNSLIRQWNMLTGTIDPDVDELDPELRQLSPSRSSTPNDTSSSTIPAGGEAKEQHHIDHMKRACHENYSKLRRVGGRPTCEIADDYESCSPSLSEAEQHFQVVQHWAKERERTKRELQLWLQFRWYQFEERTTPEERLEYQQAMDRYQEGQGLGWTVETSIAQQTILDEWREYYVYEDRKRSALQQKYEQAEENFKLAKQQRMESYSHELMELLSYNVEMLQRERSKEKQRKLDAEKGQQPLPVDAKETMTSQTRDDPEPAPKMPQVEAAERMERLARQIEGQRARQVLAVAQERFHYATKCLEQCDTRLEWTATQIAKIASQRTPRRWSQDNRRVLDSWSAYYNLMRCRLLSKLAHEDADSWIEETHPAATVQSLLDWIEQQIPDVVAQHRQPCRPDGGFDAPLHLVQGSRISKPGESNAPRRKRPAEDEKKGEDDARTHASPEVPVRRSKRSNEGSQSAVSADLDGLPEDCAVGGLRRSRRLSTRSRLSC